MDTMHDEEATLAGDEHGSPPLVFHDLSEVREPVDPRIRPSDRPSPEVLDESYRHQLSDYIHHREHHGQQTSSVHLSIEKEKAKSVLSEKSDSEEPIYIEFEKDDKRDPINFSKQRKWLITLTACYFTVAVGSAAADYALGYPSMLRDLNCTQFQATIGVSLFALGFGVVPLVSASFSEEFGRQPLYFVSAIGFALTHLMVALAPNIQTVLIGRFLGGAFGSTGSTMVGGTVSDIWSTSERGLPMAIFSVAAIAGTGIGNVAAGWVEQNPHLQWRWIQWIHLMMSGVFIIMVPLLMKETRSSVLLTKMAKKLRKETGDLRYRARAEDERASLRTLIYVSCTRPIYLLVTEPCVIAFSLWVGFAWGILYVFISGIEPIFQNLHGFGPGATGVVYITYLIGSVIGALTNIYQEKLYQKNFKTRGPEARLYAACVAAFAFPVGLFIFAWSTYSHVPWIALAISMTLVLWCLYIIYLSVFTYLADCYGPFASSALAGQSLSRNIAGLAFPLFCQQMFAKLTYHWAMTLFAFIAVIMIPIPFVLFFKGPAVRARSKFASQVTN